MDIITVYDILLFENFHSAFHHKFDVHLIARLLKSKGMKVAILNIYGEDKPEAFLGIDLIDLPFHHEKPDDKAWLECKGNVAKRLFYVLRFIKQQHEYMKEVRRFIEDKAESFYLGSYHLLMPSEFMNMKKPCYYWGLRSYRMDGFWRTFKSNPYLAFRMLSLKKKFMSNDYQRLFVSNDIIKREFLAIGVPEERMIIREERCIEQLQEFDPKIKDENFSLLVIGGLRRQKHVETTVQAFNQAGIEGGVLHVVGENTDDEYEKIVQNEIATSDNIKRVNRRLAYDEFYSYLKQAHFTLFADEKAASTVTNGTLMESVINFTPFIAPDYEPYSYYVQKYGIGLTYKSGDIESYAEVINKAHELGCNHFIPKIVEFQKTINFDNVAAELANDISKNQSRLQKI